MTDYAELLAKKSAELAELTRAFNEKRYYDASKIAGNMEWDFRELSHRAACAQMQMILAKRNGL